MRRQAEPGTAPEILYGTLTGEHSGKLFLGNASDGGSATTTTMKWPNAIEQVRPAQPKQSGSRTGFT